MATSTSDTKCDKKTLHIVALGSSFAAGPGIQPQALKAAGRSEKNYAHLLATRLDAQLTDLTVSGATLKNILSEPQTLFGNHFDPQLNSLPPNVDIVTITGGGNDLTYIGAVMHTTLQSYFLGRIISRFLPIPDSSDSLTAEDVAERFIAIIDTIRETSPRCRIYLVEYLTLFGSHTKPGVDVFFDTSKMQDFQNIVSTLQTAYRLAAEARPGCKVIPVAERSQDHGLGSAEPWVEGFGIGMLLARKAPFHPNARGMEAVSGMIYEELKDDETVSNAPGTMRQLCSMISITRLTGVCVLSSELCHHIILIVCFGTFSFTTFGLILTFQSVPMRSQTSSSPNNERSSNIMMALSSPRLYFDSQDCITMAHAVSLSGP